MTILFCWGTKKFRKTVVMMLNFKVTFCISGVLYLQAQLLVPFLIARVFWILSTLPKSVSQILAQPSATTASRLIPALVTGWNPGLKKWMGILVFASGKARIFPHVSLPWSSKGYLCNVVFHLALQYTPHSQKFCTNWPLLKSYSSNWFLPLRFLFFVTFFLLTQQPWTAAVSVSYITVNRGGKEWQKCTSPI